MEMLRPYWLDASVLVKLVYEEPGSNRIQGLVQANPWFETTWLCVAEAYGALKRHFIEGKFDSYSYHKRLYLLRNRIQEGRIRVRMGWFEGNPTSPHEVRQLGEKYELDFSDAIQLFEFRTGTLAAAAGASEAVFVTSDKGLLKAAKAEGIKVWNPETDQDPPS